MGEFLRLCSRVSFACSPRGRSQPAGPGSHRHPRHHQEDHPSGGDEQSWERAEEPPQVQTEAGPAPAHGNHRVPGQGGVRQPHLQPLGRQQQQRGHRGGEAGGGGNQTL